MSKRLILEPTERYLSGDISHPWGALKKRLAFSNLQSITVHPWGLKMEFLKIGFRCLSSNDCPKGSVFAKGEMCLLLWSQKIHFFQLLCDFWESKGSARSSNLPSSLKLSSDGDLKVLIASKSSEKSKGFFGGQLCNLSGMFFLGQRSTVREIENLKKWIRPKTRLLLMPPKATIFGKETEVFFRPKVSVHQRLVSRVARSWQQGTFNGWG